MLAALNSGFPDVTAFPPAELRALIRSRRSTGAAGPDVLVEDRTIGPLPVRVYRPFESVRLPVVVFAHGGGFVFCDLDSHDEFCRSMAVGVGAVVVAVDYRLAPEHPAPAAHDDVYTAVEWVATHAEYLGGDPLRLVLAGDSAGGNLAATVAIAARDRGLRVAAQVLLYPVIDDDFGTESYRRYGVGYYNTTDAMRWYWAQYAPAGTNDARIVPTRATTLAGLPPAVVVTAEFDPPCSAGDAYADALREAGVMVQHHRFAGLFHGFLTFPALSFTEPARQQVWRMVRSALVAPVPIPPGQRDGGA